MSESEEASPTAYSRKHQDRVFTTVLVYICLLFDNILLTVIGNDGYQLNQSIHKLSFPQYQSFLITLPRLTMEPLHHRFQASLARMKVYIQLQESLQSLRVFPGIQASTSLLLQFLKKPIPTIFWKVKTLQQDCFQL